MLRLTVTCCWLLLIVDGATAPALDLHVDATSGNDQNDGGSQPVKTIATAIPLARPGDTIHLRSVTLRDWAPFFDKSGEPGKPITLDCHGATLDGCDPLDPRGWVEADPGLFRHDDLLPLTDAIVDRLFFLWDGKLRPGMYAQVELTVAERPDALSVPKTAIVTKDG